MAITEQDRRNLFNGLEDTLGPEAANNLMELLPNTPAAQLVTREDMHANTALLHGEMAELRAELRGEMAELRGEMAELRAELRGEMAELRGEMAAGFAAAKGETQRLVVASIAANTIAVITALLT